MLSHWILKRKTEETVESTVGWIFLNCRSLVSLAAGIGSVAFLYKYRHSFSKAVWSLRRKWYTHSLDRKIYVVTSETEFNSVFPDLSGMGYKVGAVGFDCEWITLKGGRRPVSLLQLATHDGICVLIRLLEFKGSIPLTLQEFLEDSSVLKVGVGCVEDQAYLLQDYDLKVQGCLDLRYLTMETFHKTGEEISSALGLNALTKKYLGRELDKDWRVSAGNWEAHYLTQRQINYAAEDSVVGIHIFLCLMEQLWEIPLSYLLTPVTYKWEQTVQSFVKNRCGPFCDVKFQYRQKHSPPQVEGAAKNTKEPSYKQKNIPSLKDCRRAYATRKTPLYHNSFLWAPDNQVLCTCDPKKAMWYVHNNLGELVCNDPLTVRLHFEPAGRPQREGGDGRFYLEERLNLCVVCGKDESYIRKNVVPHEYRKFFPTIMKSHQSHDVVLLCTRCHQLSNQKDTIIRYKLAREHDAPIGCESDVKARISGELKAVRSAGTALLKNRSQLPQERVDELALFLKDYFKTSILTEEHIKKASLLNVQIVNENYCSHASKVVSAYQHIGLIHLEVLWREHFLESMQPKYLPNNWSVKHNHGKLRLKMSRLPPDHPGREDYRIALVGTSGEIDVPYIPQEKYREKCNSILEVGNHEQATTMKESGDGNNSPGEMEYDSSEVEDFDQEGKHPT